MGWRKNLSQYLNCTNQLYVDGEFKKLEALVLGDERHWRRHRQIWQRVKEERKRRGWVPQQAECRGIIINKLTEGDLIKVYLRVDRWLIYEINHATHEEERSEYHEILMKEESGQWRVIADEQIDASPDAVEPFVLIPTKITEVKHPEAGVKNITLIHHQPSLSRQLGTGANPYGGYDRVKAQRYADAWWNDYNPRFRRFTVDCTNYVSQCLWAGGASMNVTGRRDKGWWYRQAGGEKDSWSYSWTVAHSLYWYLATSDKALRAEVKASAGELTIGDVICYDFDGDGRWQHNVIVTDMDGQGMPLINAHTVNSRKRYWSYQDSYAWTEKTKYKFFHIIG